MIRYDTQFTAHGFLVHDMIHDLTTMDIMVKVIHFNITVHSVSSSGAQLYLCFNSKSVKANIIVLILFNLVHYFDSEIISFQKNDVLKGGYTRN